jgi:hypothetical protein
MPSPLRNRALGVSAFVGQGYSARRRYSIVSKQRAIHRGKTRCSFTPDRFFAIPPFIFRGPGNSNPAYRAHYWSFK